MTPQHRRVASWLELQYWWIYACDACLQPPPSPPPYLCAKLVAEPVRVWLLLEHGELIPKRRDALQRASSLLPEERPPIQEALRVLDDLTALRTYRSRVYCPG